MTDTFEACLAITLRHEGGWADNPRDPGGATMKGVTLGTFSAFKGRPMDKAALRAISDADLRAIYRRLYWERAGCADAPSGLDLCLFDAAVHSGPARARRWRGQAATIEAYCACRRAFLRRLPGFAHFGRGWQRRLDDIEARALLMQGGRAPLVTALAQTDRRRATRAGLAAAPIAAAPLLATETAPALPPWVLAALLAGLFALALWAARQTLADHARRTLFAAILKEQSHG